MLVSGSLDLHAKQWFSERVTKPRMRTYTTYIYNYIYIIRTRRKTIARSDPAPARQRPPHAPLTVILINRKNNTPSSEARGRSEITIVSGGQMARKGGEVVKEGFLTKSPPAEKHLAVSHS